MYAVIKVGGKQERVRPGDVIEVEHMKVDPGSAIEFTPIVVFDDEGKAHVGKALGQARVTATLVGDKKADKIKVFKYRPKSGYRRTQGHRQLMTVLEVDEVALDAGRKATREAAKPSEAEAPEQAAPAKKSASKKPAAKKPASKKPAAKKAPAKKPASKKPTSKASGKSS